MTPYKGHHICCYAISSVLVVMLVLYASTSVQLIYDHLSYVKVLVVNNSPFSGQMPNTSDVMMSNVMNSTKYPWLSMPDLPRAMSELEHAAYISLLGTLTAMFDAAKVTYIMCDGTLLGSYITHDIIPWDDDADLMVRYSDLPKVKQIFQNKSVWDHFVVTGYKDKINHYHFKTLSSLPADLNHPAYYHPNGSENVMFYHKFKFFSQNSTQAGKEKWKWPYIDVKYYLENVTHVWNLDKKRKVYYTQCSDFYPLHKRPLFTLWLPAPETPEDSSSTSLTAFIAPHQVGITVKNL